MVIPRPMIFALAGFMLLFALGGLLGALVAYERARSIPLLLAAVLVSVALYFAIVWRLRRWHQARRVGMALVALGALFALVFISQYQHFDYGQDHVKTPDIILRLGALTTLLPAIPGFYVHPNAAAQFLGPLVPLGLALALSSQVRWRAGLYAAATLLLSYSVLLTFSRGALLALGLAAVVWLGTRLSRRLALLPLALLAAGIAILLLIPLDWLGSIQSLDWAFSRAELYQNSRYIARDYAFTGIGLGDNFALVYSRYGLLILVPFLTYTHSLPLEVWMNQGLPGLVALAGIAVVFYLLVDYTLRHSRPRRVFYGAWLGVTVTLIHGLFDGRQYVEALWLMPPLFALIGLTVVTGRLALAEITPPAEAHSRAPLLAALAGAAGLIALGMILHRPLLAAWQTNLGALQETTAELSEGLDDEQRADLFDRADRRYRAALDTDPAFPPANRRLGNLYVEQRRFDAAVPLLEAAYDAEPDNPAAIKGLGLAYVWVGRIDKAAEILHRLPDPEAMSSELYTWGYWRQSQDNDLLAAYAWDTAQTMYPVGDNPDVLMGIARLYWDGGQPDRAREWYNRVLDYDPDHEGARAALAALD